MLNIAAKLLLIVVCLNASLSTAENVTQEEASVQNLKLQLIAVVHRHGLRTPETTWPKDPYSDQKKYWSIGWGQLLPKGKQQLFRLGKTLRNRYKGLLTKYSPYYVRVNSSDFDRCHMSVAALAAGWFPPQSGQNWSSKLPWQPVPIHSVPISQDRVIALKAPCARYAAELQRVQLEVAANETKEDKQMFTYLTQHMGEPITAIKQMETYYSTLLIEEQVGYHLEPWTKSVFPDKFVEKGLLSFKTYTWTKYQQRMYGGPMIKEIHNQFHMKSKGKHKMKILIYSAHDVTIVHILRALQFQDMWWPDFGAALIFELYKSQQKDYYIKLFYFKDTSTKHPQEFRIPGCSHPCPLKTFGDLTKYLRNVNWDKDCKL